MAQWGQQVEKLSLRCTDRNADLAGASCLSRVYGKVGLQNGAELKLRLCRTPESKQPNLTYSVLSTQSGCTLTGLDA